MQPADRNATPSAVSVGYWIADRAAAVPRGIYIPASAPTWAAVDIFVRVASAAGRACTINLRARYGPGLRGEPYPPGLYVPVPAPDVHGARPESFAGALNRAIATSFAATGGVACYVDLPTRGGVFYVSAPADGDLCLVVTAGKHRFTVALAVVLHPDHAPAPPIVAYACPAEARCKLVMSTLEQPDAKVATDEASRPPIPSRHVWTPADIARHLTPDPELDALICDALNSFDYELECKLAGFTSPLPPLRIAPRRRTGCVCCATS
eukprot:tig00020539_g10400.t1